MKCLETINPPPKKTKENISVKIDYFNEVSSFKLCPKNIVFSYYKHFVYDMVYFNTRNIICFQY